MRNFSHNKSILVQGIFAGILQCYFHILLKQRNDLLKLTLLDPDLGALLVVDAVGSDLSSDWPHILNALGLFPYPSKSVYTTDG